MLNKAFGHVATQLNYHQVTGQAAGQMNQQCPQEQPKLLTDPHFNEPVSVLEVHVRRLNGSANDVHAMADHLHAIADRIFGGQPVAEGNGVAAPPASYSFGKLGEAHEELERAREKLTIAVARLSSL